MDIAADLLWRAGAQKQHALSVAVRHHKPKQALANNQSAPAAIKIRVPNLTAGTPHPRPSRQRQHRQSCQPAASLAAASQSSGPDHLAHADLLRPNCNVYLIASPSPSVLTVNISIIAQRPVITSPITNHPSTLVITSCIAPMP